MAERTDDTQEQNALSVLTQIPNVENIAQPDKMLAFDGAWMPSVDPALIGPNNFQRLINMRYRDTGIEGVTGYTKVNTSIANDIATYVNIKNGKHFKAQGRTIDDYVLVHGVDGSGNGAILQNQTDVGSQGNFEASALYTDTAANLEGRFATGPAGSIAYANTKASLIWDGEEGFISSAFTTEDGAEANPIDVTDKLINILTDSANVVTISKAGRRWITILTRRPAKGFKVTVSSANGTASTLAVNYWNGTAWASVSGLSDGTSAGGITLAQSGDITFTDTVSTAKLKHFEERYLYGYQLVLSDTAGATANISEITADMSIQAPSNIWDGIYRTPIQCQVYTAADTAWEDFTVHVSESSSISLPVGCVLDGLTSSDRVIIMFDERQAGIRMTMLGNLINKNASVATVKYWDGDSWTDTSDTDGTAESGNTLAKTGLFSWNPPADEQKQTLFGTQGYAYELTVSATLTGTKGSDEEVVIDLISGIPAIESVKTFKFPVKYKSKLMYCGYTDGNEGNRVDYSEDDAPDIFNGENTSLNGYQSLYVGGHEHLTGATQLYNRFGSNLFASMVFFKVNEIYLLTGDSPLDYKIYPVSRKIGCPAPLTIDTAEVGLELGEKVARNVALFVSNSGPMMYDGATLAPIRGIDNYFDPNEVISVNFDELDSARGWFDGTYREWNILLPVGTGQTSLNYWLVYDLVRKKWFQKDTGVALDVQCGFSAADSNGDQHVYAGTTTGQMYQLENGPSWDGTEITNQVQTGDFFPSENEWDITRIRRIKFSAKRVTEAGASVEFYYYGDTDDDGGLAVRFTDISGGLATSTAAGVSYVDVTAAKANSGSAGVTWNSQPATTLDLSITSGLNRLMRSTQALNATGWAHSFRFQFSSATTNKGMQPIMWGYQWEFVRKDHSD